jgi:hypothetical protein
MTTKDEMLNRQIAVLLHGAENIESRVCTEWLRGERVPAYEVQEAMGLGDAAIRELSNGIMYRANCYRRLMVHIGKGGSIVKDEIYWQPCPDYASGPYDNVFSLVAEIEAAGYFVVIITPTFPGGLYDVKIDHQERLRPGRGLYRSKSLKRALCEGWIEWKTKTKEVK